MSSAAEIAEDRQTSRRSSEYVNMEAQAPRSQAESQTYWSQAYEAYAVVRDTVSSTAAWSWGAAYNKWEQVNKDKGEKKGKPRLTLVSFSSTRASPPWCRSPT